MHTKTAKQVLSPLADAVSALLVIISESEISQSPTPDLTQLSKAVDTQIQNLVVVAKKIAAQPSSDEQTQKQMPEACQEVVSASISLLNAAGDLKENPHSSPARQELLEGVKGILQGTTRILDVFDESEIHKILKANELLRKLMDTVIAHSVEPNMQQEFVLVLRRMAQATFTCCQAVQTRVKELVSERLAQELQNAVQSIFKESSNYLTCANMYVSWGGIPEAKRVLAASQALVASETLKIDRIVTCKDPDEYFNSIQKPKAVSKYEGLKNEVLSEPLADKWKRSAADTRDLVQKFVGESQKEVNDKKKLLDGITNEEVLCYPPPIEGTAKQFQSQLREALDEATLDLNEQKLNHDTKQLVLGIDQCLNALDSNAQRRLISELITILGDLSDTSQQDTTVGTLNDGINKVNPESVKKSSEKFEEQTTKLERVLERVLDQIPANYGNYGVIHSLHEKAKLVAPQVISDCALFQKFPNNNALTDHTQSVLQQYTEIARGLQKQLVSYDAVFTTPELLHSAELAIQQHTKNLQNALAKNNLEEASRNLGLVNALTNQYLNIVEKERENTEDAQFRAGLEKETQLLQTSIPKFVNKSTDMVNHIGHNTAQDNNELNEAVKQLGNSLGSVGKVIRNYKGETKNHLQMPVVELLPLEVKAVVQEVTPESSPAEEKSKEVELTEEEKQKLVHEQEKVLDDHLRTLTTAIKELVIVNEEQPKKLTEMEAQQDPIKAAGQDLKVEASLWASQENPVVQIVNSVAHKFLDLSQHHQELSHSLNAASKRSFIQTAQEIAGETANMVDTLQALVQNCADKRLVLQIQQTCSRIQTLGQTLKILAAVKASSPRDRDKAVQLISNGQNLVASVKMVLRDAISCSLRLKKGAPTDLFRFRKVVYRA